jgi:hypothetical protein
MTMICSRCHTATVTWRGPLLNLTHTECSSCGGRNCQEIEQDLDERDDPGECGNCGGSGVVHDCIDGQCLDSDEGCDLCERRCDWCRPRRPATPQTEARS